MVQVIVSLDLYHINYMAIATIICVYVLLGFNLWETNQRDLLRAIPKLHGYDIWTICLFKVHGLMHLSFKQLQMRQKFSIQIVESNQGFALLTTVYPVQERNTSSTITIGHIDECHYVSTTALQSNASISMCNELMNDTQSSRNKHFIMSIYAVCFSVIKLCTYWNSSTRQALHHLPLFTQFRREILRLQLP